jgi:hypothetical protein
MVFHNDVHQFKDIAKVAVGIVTGANKFFLVDNKTVNGCSVATFQHSYFGTVN